MNKEKQEKNVFAKLGEKVKACFGGIKAFFKKCGRETYSSMAFMGVGQILNGQYVKGILYALAEVLIIAYFSLTGIKDFVGFFTLGTNKGDAWLGIAGDNSVIMLLRGILSWIIIVVTVAMYFSCVKDANKYAEIKGVGYVPNFKDDLSSLLNRNFSKSPWRCRLSALRCSTFCR